MSHKTVNEVIEVRENPKVWQAEYIVTRKTKLWIQSNKENFKSKKILDLGCGRSPYKRLLIQCKCEEYVGLDNYAPLKADIVANSWETGLEDECIDVVLSTFSLEHVLKFDETVDEVHRILRKDGLFIFSLPFCHSEHGQPDDYYRFTQYFYKSTYFLKEKFEMVSMEPSNGYISSLFYLFMILIKSIPSNDIGKIINAPLIALLNSVGLILDNIFVRIPNKNFLSLYSSLPIAYFVVLKKI